MKLYATTTSERASKGQGGNKYLDISITDDNKEEIASISIAPFADNAGNGLTATVRFVEYVYVNGKNEFNWGTSKGKQKKDEVYKIRCNNCMNIYTEDELINISDMKACPKCQSDSYLMEKYQ